MSRPHPEKQGRTVRKHDRCWMLSDLMPTLPRTLTWGLIYAKGQSAKEGLAEPSGVIGRCKASFVARSRRTPRPGTGGGDLFAPHFRPAHPWRGNTLGHRRPGDAALGRLDRASSTRRSLRQPAPTWQLADGRDGRP